MPASKMSNRWCYVPYCGNTTKKTPEKLFFSVPIDEEKQKQWFRAARRKYILPKTTQLFCCEDHFNLKEDLENYVQLKDDRKKLKNDVLPHIFNCQNKRKFGKNLRPATIKKTSESAASNLGSSISEEVEGDESLNVTEEVWLVNQEHLHDKLFIAENDDIQIKKENTSDTETMEEENLIVKQKPLNELKIAEVDEMQIKKEVTFDTVTMQDCSTNQETQHQCEDCKETPIDSKHCNKCNNNLQDAVTARSGNNKPFECEYCERKFIGKHHLRNHLLIHIGDDLFECKQCNKKFRTKAALTRHELTHTGEKSFNCKDCYQKFVQRLDLGQQHFLQYTEIDPRTNKKRQKTCKVCRENNKLSYVTVVCDQCEGNPGFCIPCFKSFHL